MSLAPPAGSPDVEAAAPAGRTSSGPRRPRSRRTTPGARVAYVYILPFFLVFAAFSVYPWLSTAWVSLHDTRLSTYHESNWVGLDNYRNLFFTNDFFWNAFRNTISIGIISTVPQLCLALGIAHLLNYRMKGRTFFRVAILMPYATSLAAATVIFLELFDPKLGLVNWALDLAHLPAVDWADGKWPAQVAVSVIVTWRWTGYNALIYLAAMQAVDYSLYESAAIDGAGKWKQFLYVTLPGIGRRSCSPSSCRPSVRPSSSVSRCSTTTACPTAAPATSTRPSACSCTSRAGPTTGSASPRRPRG